MVLNLLAITKEITIRGRRGWTQHNQSKIVSIYIYLWLKSLFWRYFFQYKNTTVKKMKRTYLVSIYTNKRWQSGRRVHLPMRKMQETQVQSLDWEDPLEKEMATHSSILAWEIPWTEDNGRLHSMGSQHIGHNWATEHIWIQIKLLHVLGLKPSQKKQSFKGDTLCQHHRY